MLLSSCRVWCLLRAKLEHLFLHFTPRPGLVTLSDRFAVQRNALMDCAQISHTNESRNLNRIIRYDEAGTPSALACAPLTRQYEFTMHL